MTHSKFWKEISDDCEDVTEAEDCVDALEWDTKNNPALAAKKPPPVYLYIVMQLCQKESLRVWLRNTSETRSRVKALFMFNEICNGVEYVHSQGLIHRYVIIYTEVSYKILEILFSLRVLEGLHTVENWPAKATSILDRT